MNLIDFHTHILPGIDDGSADVNESLALLRLEAEQGIHTVIATPHFYPQQDTLERFLQGRDNAFAKLCDQMRQTQDIPQLLLGAEVGFFHGMSQSDQLEWLTIGGKKCILIEMPSLPWTEEMYRELEMIYLQREIVPIIAHIDRYLNFANYRMILRRIEHLPIAVQANASFFRKRWASALALRMLKEDRIHLLGSDCHNLRARRPNMDVAIQKIRTKLGEDALERIQNHQHALLGM